MIHVDISNLPEYMKECIVEDPNEAGIVIDSQGNVHIISKVFESHIVTKDDVKLYFSEKLIFISDDF
jgi:hypothetical protein